MTDTGLVHKWKKDEKAKVEGSRGNDGKDSIGAITLKHLQAAFFFLLLGHTFSGLAFLLEWVRHSRVLRLAYSR